MDETSQEIADMGKNLGKYGKCGHPLTGFSIVFHFLPMSRKSLTWKKSGKIMDGLAQMLRRKNGTPP